MPDPAKRKRRLSEADLRRLYKRRSIQGCPLCAWQCLALDGWLIQETHCAPSARKWIERNHFNNRNKRVRGPIRCTHNALCMSLPVRFDP